MPERSTRSQHPDRVAHDVTTALTSSYDDDGFAEIQLDAYGDDGSVQAQGAGWFGVMVRPLDAEDGVPSCEIVRLTSGEQELAFCGVDPRVVPKLPLPLQKGGVVYYDAAGSYLLFKPDDKTIEVHPASGGKVRIVVGSTVFEQTESGISITGDLTVSGEVTAKSGAQPVRLSTHVHPTGVGPSGAPTPGS